MVSYNRQSDGNYAVRKPPSRIVGRRKTMWEWENRKNQVEIAELIRRDIARIGTGTIRVSVRPADDGGVNINYNGIVVAEGLNTLEAFMTLAGMMKNGPQNIHIVMPTVSENFTHHYLTGYRATK